MISLSASSGLRCTAAYSTPYDRSYCPFTAGWFTSVSRIPSRPSERMIGRKTPTDRTSRASASITPRAMADFPTSPSGDIT